MTEADDDALMAGFLFLKAVVHRYGVDRSADMLALANRLVENGSFLNKRDAVNAIERQMGIEPTTPMSKEGATHATRERLRAEYWEKARGES